MAIMIPATWRTDADRGCLVHWCGHVVPMEDYKEESATYAANAKRLGVSAGEPTTGPVFQFDCLQHDCDADSRDAYQHAYRLAYAHALIDNGVRTSQAKRCAMLAKADFPRFDWERQQASPCMQPDGREVHDFKGQAQCPKCGVSISTDGYKLHVKGTISVPSPDEGCNVHVFGDGEHCRGCGQSREAVFGKGSEIVDQMKLATQHAETVGPQVAIHAAEHYESPKAIDPERFREELAKIAAPTPEGAAAMRRLGIEVLDRDPRAQALIKSRALSVKTATDVRAGDLVFAERSDDTPHAGIKVAGGDGRGGQPPMLAIRKARGAEKPGEELTLQRYDGSKVEPEPVTGGGGGSSSPAHRPHFRIKSMKIDGVEYAPRRRYANMAEVNAHLGPDKAMAEEVAAAIAQAEVECRAAEAERKSMLFGHISMEDLLKEITGFAKHNGIDFERMEIHQVSTDANPFACILEIEGDKVTDDEMESVRERFAGIVPGWLKASTARWGVLIEREPRVQRLATEEDLKKPGAATPASTKAELEAFAKAHGTDLDDFRDGLTVDRAGQPFECTDLTRENFDEAMAEWRRAFLEPGFDARVLSRSEYESWAEGFGLALAESGKSLGVLPSATADEKTYILGRLVSYGREPFQRGFDSQVCTDCAGSGQYVGALEVTDCHECGGTGWAKP